MYRKTLVFIALFSLFIEVAYAAPQVTRMRSIEPETGSTYFFGSSTLPWLTIISDNASSTNGFFRTLGVATGTPGTALSVTGTGVFSEAVYARNFIATSTTQPSVFPLANITELTIDGFSNGDLHIGGDIYASGGDFFLGTGLATTTISGDGNGIGIATSAPGSIFSIQGVANFAIGTSTMFSGLQLSSLMATSGITITGGSLLGTGIGAVLGSTSVSGLTSANGITLTGGCFSVNGSCIGSGITGSGADTRVAFWNGPSSLSSNASFLWNNTAGRLSFTLGSSTDSFSIGNLLDVDGTGTSTFDGALQLAKGIRFSTDDQCITGPTNARAHICFNETERLAIGWNALGIKTEFRFTDGAIQSVLSGTEVLRHTTSGLGLSSSTPWGMVGINPNGITYPAFTIGSSTRNDFIVDSKASTTPRVGIGTTTPRTGELEVAGDIFYKGQAYSEWIPMSVVAPSTIFDCAQGNRFSGTASIAIVILTPKNCKSGQTVLIRLAQDGTGGRRIDWATSTMLNGQPVASTTANSIGWYGVAFFGSKGTVLAATSTSPNAANP